MKRSSSSGRDSKGFCAERVAGLRLDIDERGTFRVAELNEKKEKNRKRIKEERVLSEIGCKGREGKKAVFVLNFFLS